MATTSLASPDLALSLTRHCPDMPEDQLVRLLVDGAQGRWCPWQDDDHGEHVPSAGAEVDSVASGGPVTARGGFPDLCDWMLQSLVLHREARRRHAEELERGGFAGEVQRLSAIAAAAGAPPGALPLLPAMSAQRVGWYRSTGSCFREIAQEAPALRSLMHREVAFYRSAILMHRATLPHLEGLSQDAGGLLALPRVRRAIEAVRMAQQSRSSGLRGQLTRYQHATFGDSPEGRRLLHALPALSGLPGEVLSVIAYHALFLRRWEGATHEVYRDYRVAAWGAACQLLMFGEPLIAETPSNLMQTFGPWVLPAWAAAAIVGYALTHLQLEPTRPAARAEAWCHLWERMHFQTSGAMQEAALRESDRLLSRAGATGR